MNCNIVKDLIPLYIDGCCSEDSAKAVEEHLLECESCKELLDKMTETTPMEKNMAAPVVMSKINDRKASVLQSLLLLASFLIITIGVALEARTPSGFLNGFWALNLVVPVTGFLLSLTNWYFVRQYKSRRRFSNWSLLCTFGITLVAYIWSFIHYDINLFELFGVFSKSMFYGGGIKDIFEGMYVLAVFFGGGFVLTLILCVLSKLLSDKYGKLLGKE